MSKSKSIMRRILGYLKPYSFKITISLILLLITTFFSLVPPLITKYAVDTYILTKQSNVLWLVAVAIVVLGLFEGLTNFLQQYLNEYIGYKIVTDIRSKLFFHLNSLSFSYYDKAKTGDIMARVVSDTDTLKRFLGFGIIRIIINTVTILGIMSVMFFWDWKLGILFLSLIPLMVHAMMKYSKKVRPLFSSIRKKTGKLTSYLQESFSGIQVIKTFGNEEFEIKRFGKINNSYFKANVEAGRIAALWMPYVNFLVGLGSGLVLWIGGVLVINNEVTVGILLGALSYTGMLVRPIRQTGMMLSLYNQAKASSMRIFEVLDTESEIKNVLNAVRLKNVEGKIDYKNVSFSYNEKEEILKDINLSVKPKQLVAVVGSSGAGKTTLLHLLPRFYDVKLGEILIDGKNIKEYTIESLRKNIGIVMQNTFLFDGTIKDNIAYGMSRIDMGKIKWAAKIAQLDEYIEQLPLQYNTPIGERGVRLSGGQAQRLSIARVLVTNPKILLLDEPTSSVDAVTDEKLMTALKEVIKNRTTFVIAHRLWTIKNAELIVVIDKGMIAGIGTHQELMGNNRFYNQLFASQFANKGTDREVI